MHSLHSLKVRYSRVFYSVNNATERIASDNTDHSPEKKSVIKKCVKIIIKTQKEMHLPKYEQKIPVYVCPETSKVSHKSYRYDFAQNKALVV